jgi:hypothetical protein
MWVFQFEWVRIMICCQWSLILYDLAVGGGACTLVDWRDRLAIFPCEHFFSPDSG